MSRRIVSAVAFGNSVDAMTKAALGEGASSFSALLHRLPAIYPTEVLSSLERLAATGVIEPWVAAEARRQAGERAESLVEGRSLLPVPHPLDYEWRFTPDASRELLDRATALTPPGGDLLLFGTPGLAVEALTLPPHRRLAFLAENNSVTQRVIALNHATGSPLDIAFCSGGLPRETADAVILDPPWYPDFVRPMLAAAAHACRLGGVVLISLPPFCTRPSAEADHRAALAFGRRLGLDPFEHEALAIRYATPFFERNALAAAGIYPPPYWRRGDLVMFRKTRSAVRLPAPSGSNRRPWTEVIVGRMRLFVRRGAPTAAAAGIRPLVDGEILPSVSRRDPRRRHGQLWTSGNRVYRTSNPQLVLDAANSCGQGVHGAGAQHGLWGTVSEREARDRVADRLRAVAALEAHEEQGVVLDATERSMSCTLPSMTC